MFKWKRQNQNEEISEKNNRWASLTKDSHIELLLIKSNEKCENKSLFSFEKQVYAVVELSGIFDHKYSLNIVLYMNRDGDGACVHRELDRIN